MLELQLSARSDSQLPFAKLELLDSRGPWLGEPLAAAAIGWACALTAVALPERQPYPTLYEALGGLLSAICHAPSARGWAGLRNRTWKCSRSRPSPARKLPAGPASASGASPTLTWLRDGV